ncbi:hypothetical protein BABINDRAFT_169766 [Babjeviella inositovora NRRL Y-12698]|uniref:DUF221-domain-containing protein n=1 Tax=Babjeviella inositovora NRRL Y-12698 TaxID=984486 RepID=A0A1E3QXR3_9ASCO|nr:uncharacterized protein BABINDRAFT_169766 [Babjeviella inositovora NRRL Y-12698]ODQ82453.1 hypothetical protein BABINDRAFT_169766 [Babjeviella inositovora NRRL Y-12698]
MGLSTSNTSTQSIITSFTINGVVCAVFVLGFLLLRGRFKRIYQPKSAYDLIAEDKKPEPLPSGIYRWFIVLIRKPHAFILQQAGIDGYFFIRYLYVLGWICFWGCIVLLPILLPVNVVGGRGNKGFDLLTFSNVTHHSRYYAHAILSWFFYGGVMFVLYRELFFFTSLRQAALSSPRYAKKLSSRTVLFQTVTDQFLDEEEFFKLFDGVKKIWVARAQPDLSAKVKQRQEMAMKLEAAETKLLTMAYKAKIKAEKKGEVIEPADEIVCYVPQKKRPSHRKFPLFGKKVDTITELSEKLPELNREVEEMQANFRNARPLNSIFVEFESQYLAQIAFQTVLSHSLLHMNPKQIGIEPQDIIWSNMRLMWWERLVREATAAAASCGLVVLWAIPVAFVGMISNITYLVDKLPWLGFIMKLPKVLLGVITSLLPTIVLSVLMSFLPIFIRGFAKLSGAASTQQVEHYTQNVYFAFQVVHVFLITTVTSSATSVVTLIIEHPQDAMTLLASGLPKSSNFFVSYLLLQGLSVAGGALLQIATLVMFYIMGLLDTTPRKKWTRWTSLSSFSWGTAFPVHTNLAVITLSYAIISPLILLFACLCFALLYIVYLHNITYIFVESADGRGMYYPRAIFQTFTGLYLGQVCLLGLFVVGKGWGPIVLELIALGITIFVHINLLAAFSHLVTVLPVDCMKPSDGVSETPSYPGQKASEANFDYQNAKDVKAHATQPLTDAMASDGNQESQWGLQPLLAEDVDYYEDPPNYSRFFRYFLPSVYLSYAEVKKMLPEIFHYPLEADMAANEHAYDFPDVSATQPVLWLPRDPMGLSEKEIDKLDGVISASDEGAMLDHKGKSCWTTAPPNVGNRDDETERQEDLELVL